MTIESLACPSCGSTQVKEIKAGTFFCDHCESLFKHVDPTQVSVAPAFCNCGNQITRQCNICRVGLCVKCEAASPDKSWGILIGVTGYGYRLSRRIDVDLQRVTHSRYRTVQHSSIAAIDPSDDWTRLVMPAAKLHRALEEPEAVKHVCWDCLAAGVPSLAEAIDQGRICEDPFCPQPPVAMCRCCQKHYCMEGLVGDQEVGAVILANDPNTPASVIGLPVDWPSGICWACAEEGGARMKDVFLREFPLVETPPGELGPFGRPNIWNRPSKLQPDGLPSFRLADALGAPGAPPSRSRGDQRRHRRDLDNHRRSLPRTFDESRRIADELRTRWQREQFAHPCARVKGLLHEIRIDVNDNHPYLFGEGRPWAYVVVDERDDGGAPTAVPGLAARS